MMGIFLTLEVSKYTPPEITLLMENMLIKWTKTTPGGTKVSLCKSEFANKPEKLERFVQVESRAIAMCSGS